ncbi:MAG TPA: cupin domain-containing protein [Dehalococcoidia bacterium]|nr:cupin domain-containing protein [Dehalococcoidia bacterium]
MTNGAGVTVLQGQGTHADALGAAIRLITLGKDTDGLMDVLEAEFPAGMSFATHIHRNSDEAFYVLEGELVMHNGDRTETVSTGAFGYSPRGIAHGFENKSNRPAKILAWQTPAWGADRFVAALAQLPPGPPDMNKLMEIFQQYDFEPA